jgi:cytochrome P450
MEERQKGPAVAEMTRITAAAEVEEILRSPDIAADLHNRDSSPLLGGSVLTLTRGDHLTRRRLEARLFARDALHVSEQEVLMPAVRRRLASRTAARLDPAQPVTDDLLVFSRMVLVEMTARLIGLDGIEGDDELERLYECAEQFGEAASVEWALTDHDRIVLDGLAASEVFVDRWFRQSYRRRQELVAAGQAAPLDLLSLLIEHAPDMDEDDVRREAIFFLLASSSTTTHAVPHIVLELLHWIDAHPEDAAKVGEVAFVRQVVNEGLRLHPPVPALLRRSLRAVTLSTGRRIAEGECLALDLDAAVREVEVSGDQPDRFDPYRPMAGGAHPYGFSFGGGPHTCLGRPLATSTSKTNPDEAAAGTIVVFMMELMEAGMSLDPGAGEPRRRTDTAADRFESFPVIFTGL